MKFRPDHEKPHELMNNWGMQMEGKMDMDHSKMDQNEKSKMDMSGMDKANQKTDPEMAGMNLFSEYNYDYLKSPEKTQFAADKPVKEVLLNLTGNMWRYIWSMNGVPLSEAEKIEIEKGQVVRITLNNLTMMHHPMHLHGHFFRVINDKGEYSPLKHTVNVPAMQKVTIEFDAN
jgi:FtsP/CotA-like multicopper oxidase with cupredoxin domain